jgi:hypothetical protein
MHDCGFDYFAENQKRLNKENPMLIGNKMEEI